MTPVRVALCDSQEGLRPLTLPEEPLCIHYGPCCVDHLPLDSARFKQFIRVQNLTL